MAGCVWIKRRPLWIGSDISFLFILFLSSIKSAFFQGPGIFPQLINVAERKPISTAPEIGTCGYNPSNGSPVTMAFCRSSTVVTSVTSCHQTICSQGCPSRTSQPSPTPVLSPVSPCIRQDSIDVRPRSPSGVHSLIFDAGCFISPGDVPIVGSSGRFTLSVWLKPELLQEGTLIEKRSSTTGIIIYTLLVSPSTVSFEYRTSPAAAYLISAQANVPTNQWTHLVLQVYDRKVSFFVNGLAADGTPQETRTLQGQMYDESNANVRMGQRLTGGNQYLGRMQDFYIYSETLTNREIVELATGSFPQVHTQSDCRCQDSHPRISPLEDRYCLRNGDPDTTTDQVLRLHQDAYPLEFANDGDVSTKWISTLTDDIMLYVDLVSGEFQVFYVVLQFYSPQPVSVTISRRANDSSDWNVWQYYADDCMTAFGMSNNGPLALPTSVNCLQFPSDPPIPYSKGNITFQLLAPEPIARPGYNDFYNNPALLQFVRATQIRIHMQNHYHINNRRHRYYGLEEVTVSARCDCSGHALECDLSVTPYQCICQHNTMEDHCDSCLPLYNDKPFRHGDQEAAYACKPCTCYGHANRCEYNITQDPFPDDHDRGGGGICINCQHNTEGRYCDRCQSGYYRETGTPLDSPDVCRSCDCYVNGTVDGSEICDTDGGQCQCKAFTTGRRCDTCQLGYFNLQNTNPQGCEDCGCQTAGTADGDPTCHQATGICTCKTNVIDDKCNRCNYSFFNLSTSNPQGCQPCNCNPIGGSSPYCNPDTGDCQCNPGVQGLNCDQCLDGYHGLGPGGCLPCDCEASGSVPGSFCDKVTGRCLCKANVEGVRCDQCRANSYNLQQSNSEGCSDCACNTAGTVNASTSCDVVSGVCRCKALVTGRTCNRCLNSHWGLEPSNPNGCLPCGCDPTGTQQDPGGALVGCDQNSGECSCLNGRTGRQCGQCSVGYLSLDIGGGCLPCNCHPAGSISDTCHPVTGQCQCDNSDVTGVSGRRCDSCSPVFWNFHSGTGRCELCGCNPAGSLNTTCEPSNGLCMCKGLVTGRQCDTCKSGTANLQPDNPLGCSKAPEQQPAPSWIALSPFSLGLVWDPPDSPNGNILEYRLYRNGVLVYRGLSSSNPLDAQEYNDTSLFPYTQYTYYVEAVNEAGSTASPSITATTPDAIPANFDVLTITNVGPRTADFSWFKPPQITAPITRYILTSVTLSQPLPPTQHYSGGDTNYAAGDLIPFTNYTFFLTVCTADDCGRGIGKVIYTPMAAPEGVQEANAVGISTTALHVTWEPPTEPNGIITHYELFMRGLPGPAGVRDPPETRIFFPAGYYNPRPTVTPLETPAEPPATNYTVEGLDPFTVYEFKVTSRNAAGTGESKWTRGRTLEAHPLSTPAPTVYGISSTQLNVTWQAPSERQALGFIIMYNLHQIVASDDPFAPPERQMIIYTSNGSSIFHIVNNLQPYASHEFVVEACNSIGCVMSDRSSGRTLEAAPEGLYPPFVNGYNFSTMSITWSPPLQQNGPTPVYTAVRTIASFSANPPRVEKGTRFPGGAYYRFPSSTLPSSAYTGIEFEFRAERSTSPTTPINALLFLAVSPGEQEEFIAIQLRDGRPWFLFDPQGGVAAVTPTNDGGRAYDDGRWHHVLATRNGVTGSITVDRTYTGQASASTGSTIIGMVTGLYVGGLPPDFTLARTDDGNSAIVRKSFVGCMRRLRVEKQRRPTSSWEELEWEKATESRNTVPGWQGCPVELEDGVHFLGKGYAVFPENTIPNGLAFIATMNIRTEFSHGLLMFAYSPNGAFLLLQLVNGNLQLVLATGSGSPLTLTTSGSSLCDGQWHSLTVVQNGAQVTVSTLGGALATGSLNDSTPLILTSSLYLGGIGQGLDADIFADSAALTLQSGFGGCLRQLVISGSRLDFSTHNVWLSGVYLDGCPGVPMTSSPCVSPSVNPVYTGQDASFADHGLGTYTEYLYQVTASNNAGSTSSEWAVGRTREGSPTGVTPPTDPVALSGYIIQLSWQRPTGNTGLLLHYILTAYDQDRTNMQPVQMYYNETGPLEYIGNITNVIPFTSYQVTVTACTAGGCTESSAVSLMTLQEPPEVVNPPEAISVTPDAITLRWLEPDRPNGVIISYTLTMNGLVIYTGTQQLHTESGLQVFTAYRFQITACTGIGCTESPEVTIHTAQLPPTFVPSPTLLVRGPTSIEVSWQEPPQLNGRLERYILFLSILSAEIGEEVHNSTELVRSHILSGLTAGTNYFVTLTACTGGGCTNSAPATTRTEESIPEDVPAPDVRVISPYQLRVTWTPPAKPNGIITRYTLIQDGSVVQSGLNLTHDAIGLAPHSLHIFRLEACTSRGCSYGPETTARTAEAPPTGSITLSVFVTDARTVSARWTAPANPNGIMHYEVMFTGSFYVAPEMGNYNTLSQTKSLLNTTDANRLVTISSLIPDSAYTVQVLGYNTKGSLLSNQQNIRTPYGSPDGVFPPTLITLSSVSIRAQWQEPARLNAPGEARYQLQFRPALQPGLQEDLFDSPVSVTSYIQSGLNPYTEYEFRVIASNNFGETESEWTAGFTLEAAPGAIDPPMATVLDAYNMLVTWEQPNEPNGVITLVRLYQNNLLREVLAGNVTEFLANGLMPYTDYYFHIEMCNSAGCSSSLHSLTYRTPQAIPSGLAPPMLRSETPTSILITWSAPTVPSGILTGYEIQRRLKGHSAVTTVVSVGPSSPLVYLDQSPAVTPYTVFEYRVRVRNGVGAASSMWQEVTTLTAAPGGVNPPSVTTIDHDSMLVAWQPPAHSNGDIISYTIRMPQPRVYISSTNTTSRIVDGLVPYTNYLVTIEVCTIGGCTESSGTPARTDPYIPAGQAAPRGDPITQTYISVTWQAPTMPNGPNIRYELHRKKIRQPLQQRTPTGIGFWQLIYSGTQTSYADLSLTTFTTYQYRVTVSNNVGSMTSDPGSEVTTLAGRPSIGGTLSAVAVDHVTVSLSWTTPTLHELQGDVINYFIEYGASATPGIRTTSTFLPGVSTTTIGLLMPNTLYEFRLLIFNGAYNVSSNLAYAETQDGAPEGFPAPTITILSPSALRVSWQTPVQPNGDILRYIVYQDDTVVAMLSSTNFSHVLSNLQPYTVYAIQVEVCTIYDCLLSNATLTTTLEAPPTSMSPPNLRVLGSEVINVDWAAPAQSNGIILQYELYRRAYVPCEEDPGSGLNTNRCLYLECSVTESICGNQCYSGSQICCDGMLHSQRPDYECCGTNYLPARAASSDVCCGGQFHSYQQDHQCCRGQYVRVPTGQICCSDPIEDRVAVGAGDACCRGIPYDTSGPQICCGGSFYDKTQGLCCQSTFVPFDDTFQDGFRAQCCGSSVISADRVCCQENSLTMSYDPEPNKVCCGIEYVDPAVTLCCISETGIIKAHSYPTLQAKQSANDQCCGAEKIAPSQACCNTVGYNPLTHVCADRGTNVEGNCGGGTVCTISQAATAFCNRCNFDKNTNVCATISGQYSTLNQPSSPVSGDSELCLTALESVVTTSPNTYSYLDEGLSPHTTYEYAITAHNSVGSATSDYSSALTNEAIPSGVRPPDWKVGVGVLDTIILTWREPALPNGVITTYILRRDNIEIYRGLDTTLPDNRGIQPYQHYTYVLGACTSVGCANSEPVIAATLQDAPANLFDPTVRPLDASMVQITWQQPGRPNGVIQEYRIMQVGLPDAIYTGDSTVFEYVHSGLSPFSSYEYTLVACTAAGCTSSNPVQVTTPEAPPQGVSSPVHVVISSTILELYWSPPSILNGIITSYRLYRFNQLIYTGTPSSLMFTDTNLLSNTRYEYVLEASTSAGSTNSSVYACQTPEGAPEGIPIPSLTVLSSSSIRAVWQAPTIPHGVIRRYGVVILSGTPEQRPFFSGLGTSIVIRNLTPFRLYDVRVEACTDSGCGHGPKAYARTFQAPPEGQGPPTLVATGSTVIDVSWEPPSKPNGNITRYLVYRRQYGTTQLFLVYQTNSAERSFTNAGGGLLPFTLYEYRITAHNAEGMDEGPWASVRTLESPPQGVAQPDLLAISSYAIMASWQLTTSPNGLITAYRLEYQRIANDPTLPNPVIPAATVEGSLLQTTFYGLSPFTSYRVRIVAINGAGETAGPWGQVTTLEGVPAGIGQFTVVQQSDGRSLVLRWPEPAQPNGHIQEYRIYEDVYLITPIYIGLTREYLFRRLNPYTEYVVVLEACTNIGCGRGEPQRVTTAEVPPANQASPTLGEVTSSSVQLIWSPPVNANGWIQRYDVVRRTATATRRRRDTDSSAFTDTRIVHQQYDTDAESFSYTDYSLQPHKLYEYRIVVTNSVGQSESPWVSVQTEQASPVGVSPPEITHVANDPTALHVQWSRPVQANGIITGYLLKRNDSAPFSFESTSSRQFTDQGLMAYTVYAYTITACTGGGCTESLPTFIRTLETAPGSVAPPTAVPLSSTSIQLTWISPSLDAGEIVRYDLKMDDIVKYSGSDQTYTSVGLTPYQEYSFSVVACTAGGCTESLPTTSRPFEASPTGMNPPVLRALSAIAVEASWTEPQMPNGVILRYELRRDGKLVYDGIAMRFQDFGEGGRGLTPGQEYSYVVTAFNSQGQAISEPATVLTSSSSPAGLNSPDLTVLSSSSIRATWLPPLYPNGEIQNYTLYVEGNIIYSGRQFSFDVHNLDYFTEYEFRLGACTITGCALSDRAHARTFENAPTNQVAPTLTPLTNNLGVASGVLAEWGLPQQPNGFILGYKLHRRRYYRQTNNRDDPVLIYEGPNTRYTDMDTSLVPDATYEYMVTSMNSQGQTSSSWALVRMLEAPPQGLQPPQLVDIESTSLTVNILAPSQPNGDISSYTIIRNGTELIITTVTSYPDSQLQPFTLYAYAVRACTAGGCTTSSEAVIRTEQALPSGMGQPTVTEVGTTWVHLAWDHPSHSNGVILGFELNMRASCPPTSQPFIQPCSQASYRTTETALVLSHNATGLQPYTNYEFVVMAYNDQGPASSPAAVQATLATDPEFIPEIKPAIFSNTTSLLISIDWAGSFRLNGMLREYQLTENGDVVYSGIATGVQRPLKTQKYEWSILCKTAVGSVSYPTIIYEPPGIPGTTKAPLVTWYTSVWFIAIMALIGVVILFILIAIALSRVGTLKPYERERRPLPPRQQRGNFTFNTCGKYSETESILDPIPQAISRSVSLHSLRNAYTNPSFLDPTQPIGYSRGATPPEKMKQFEDSGWDSHVLLPKLDSGMGFDEETMTHISQPYSYTKEQTMFTDTHL